MRLCEYFVLNSIKIYIKGLDWLKKETAVALEFLHLCVDKAT